MPKDARTPRDPALKPFAFEPQEDTMRDNPHEKTEPECDACNATGLIDGEDCVLCDGRGTLPEAAQSPLCRCKGDKCTC